MTQPHNTPHPCKTKPTGPARGLAGRREEETTAEDSGWASRSSAASVVENTAQALRPGLETCWAMAQATFGTHATPQVAVELLALSLDAWAAGVRGAE